MKMIYHLDSITIEPDESNSYQGLITDTVGAQITDKVIYLTSSDNDRIAVSKSELIELLNKIER